MECLPGAAVLKEMRPWNIILACCVLMGFCWRSRWAPLGRGSRSALGLGIAPMPSWHCCFHPLGLAAVGD